MKILEKELSFTGDDAKSNSGRFNIDFMLGHSLGEYSALLAARSIEFPEALSLVRTRGLLMKQAKQGTMAALLSKENMLLNGSFDKIQQAAQSMYEEDQQDICGLSNINSPSQVVISGTESGVNKICTLARKQKLCSKAVKLEVSAAFHSKLMEPSSLEFNRDHLNRIKFNRPLVPVISNVTGLPNYYQNKWYQK
eukprot:gene3740-4314_t